MKIVNRFRIFIVLVLPVTIFFISASKHENDDDRFITYEVNPRKSDLRLYWKNDSNTNFRSIQNLKSWLENHHQTLVFAMNAGMYKQDNSPLGLYVENKKRFSPLNKASANGNFYLKPNGVFYITTDNIPIISETAKFVDNGKIKYATQSGPMLVIDGKIHPAFKQGSMNVNIRNGVGILPNNDAVFIMSKKEINFYDFAAYFLSLGCKNALYLDGFVSRTYLPEKNWAQTGGDFGVIIGVTKPSN
ncbi:MAG TPA: phosphodiester glycosidase family protein [Puia sp.]|nr:phosphodiester glycosidase family protein [Puia sp.]